MRNASGFTKIELLTLIGVIGLAVALVVTLLPGFVVILIPKGEFEAQKTQCMANIRNMVGLLEFGQKYPEKSGPELILYLVRKGEIQGTDRLELLFCPGDTSKSLTKAGGEDSYKDLDPTKRGGWGHLTSYAGRDELDPKCRAEKAAGKAVALICDDSEDHHGGKGFVVGYTGGIVKWRDKDDDWRLRPDAEVTVGKDSVVPELRCRRED